MSERQYTVPREKGPKLAMQMSLSATLWGAAHFMQTLLVGLGRDKWAAYMMIFAIVAGLSMVSMPILWAFKARIRR